MKLRQYDDEVLNTWRTERLGALYMSSYIVSRGNPEEESQLERIARLLSTRPLEEKESMLLPMRTEIRVAQKLRDYTRAQSYAQMMGHYIETVIRPNQNDGDRT